jgi:simple sugar transport system permease protein
MVDFFSAIADVMTNDVTYSSAVRFATLLAFCAIGETIAERAGTLNISTEAMILGGAFAAAVGYDITESVTVGLLFSVGSGLSVAAVHANLSHRLTANTFVVGLTLNILVLGLATFLNRNLEPLSRQANTFEVPVLVDIPLLGPALFGQSWPLYLIYPLIPLAWWVLYRTRWGLEVRSVGENPQAADVSGIDVNKRRRQGVYVSGITSGLGGGYLLLGQIGRFEEGMVGGQGFIAIAALIFGGWTLRGAVAGCLVFGAVNSFRLSIPTNGYEVNTELLLALPFIVTIVTVSVFAHRTRQPAALARPFIRGLT